jgi:TPR repeat protein
MRVRRRLGVGSPAVDTFCAKGCHSSRTPRSLFVPEFVTRQLDPDELASMLRRADDFIKAGDLSSARLLLRRAAEGGSMQAALTLAGTFDPNVLAALNFQDGAADIAMARFWYERAEQLGSSEAPRRLRQLASNSLQ